MHEGAATLVLSTGRPYRRAVAVAVVFVVTAGMLLGVGPSPAVADVTMVTGSAFGYHSFDITLFGGAQDDVGPTPTVELASDASNSPQTATEPEGEVILQGIAQLFTSGPITVSTEGSVGPSGSVTTTATIDDVNRGGSEVFDADDVTSTCTATEDGVTGSTTVTNGTLRTHAQGTPDDPDHPEDNPEGEVAIPTDPEPNHEVDGHLHVGALTDTFTYVFNEQVENPDGSLTVNAVHAYFHADDGGPLTGELIIGQVVCGVTADTTTTTTTVPGTTTTTVPSTTPTTTTTTIPPATPITTIAPTPTTTPGADDGADDTPGGAGATEVGGGAFGYFTDVSLFGGPSETRGPEPTVTLAADASNSPQDASIASAEAVYGPAVVFRSGQIAVHTEGALGADGSVTSSSSVQGAADRAQRPGPFLFDAAESTCTADEDGVTATATIAGGVVETSYDPGTQAPLQTEPVPTNPSPGHTVEGTIDHVGDSFRIVFNEQITNADGSITVNAAHMYLLGPIAVGEVIIGQSECAWGTAATGTRGGTPDGDTGGSGTGRGAGTGSGTDGRLARSGSDPLPAAALGFGLMLAGMFALQGGRRGRVVDGRLR